LAIRERRYIDAARLVDALTVVPPWMRKSMAGVLYHVAGDEQQATELLRAAVREAPTEKADSGHEEVFAITQSLLGDHAAAIATIDATRAVAPEARDGVNGPAISFVRSVILARAGRSEEGYAEARRLLRVPFGSPRASWDFSFDLAALLVKDDPHFDELLNHPPRL
jgi:hypothetical protein